MPKPTVSPLFVSEDLSTDVVVVGAGVAGLCAAVAAARCGPSVVLVTDRPVLGGSASVEVGVGMNGAAYSPFNLWARETGIAEEIRNRHAACWSGQPDSYWTAMDRVYWDLALGEPNLRVLLNTTVVAADTEEAGSPGRAILRIHGLQLRAETVYTISGKFFIDCSGDGTLGAMVGADSRTGREARAEFGESLAPESADARTMGTTLLWRSRDVGKPSPFTRPDWALDVGNLPTFVQPGSDMTRDISREGIGGFHGLWWAEFGGQIDTLHDDQKVLLHTRALVYGIWDWIKNSGRMTHVPNLANQELVHVATLGGKRESRRLLGPVILTENHWRKQERFDDAVCYSGWPIDIHPPRGYLDDQPGCTHVWLPGPSDIPLRALYSRNVGNLFFAGRCLSVTHVALGSPRVVATTATCGQAAGVAAATCVRAGILPRSIQPSQVTEIQQRLLRMDQGIIGRSLGEPSDLARLATITASSMAPFENTQGNLLMALDPPSTPDLAGAVDHEHNQWFSGSAGVLVAIPSRRPLDCLDLQFAADEGLGITCQLFLAERPENYRCCTLIGERVGKANNEGWARFELGDSPGAGLKYLLYLPPQPGVALRVSPAITPGIMAARVWDRANETLYDHELSRAIYTPCFRTGSTTDLFAAANVADGHIRPHGLPHLWRSAPMRPGQAETLKLEWRRPISISTVELAFDSQLNSEPRGIAATLVREYELIAQGDGKPQTLARAKGNFLRFVRHTFAPVCTTKLELRIIATHGAPQAGVYAMRVYS